MTEPFILFAGDRYYPLGGWSDFKGFFESKEAAINWLLTDEEWLKSRPYECWAHVAQSGKILVKVRHEEGDPWDWESYVDENL
jgi:hypothetical protein